MAELPTTRNLLDRIMSGVFNRPLIQNNLRSIYVEYLVEALLGDGWRLTSADWAGWDIEGPSGLRVEVKQSAARQSWKTEPSKLAVRSFDIAARTGYWRDGSEWVEEPGRPADIFVFCWHGELDDTCDHREPSQWRFFVLPEDRLPKQKSISIGRLEKVATPTDAVGLRDEVVRVAALIGGET